MSGPPPGPGWERYPGPRPPRRRRSRGIAVLATAAVLVGAAALVLLVGPWAHHLGLPWLGSGSPPGIVVTGGDGAWRNKAVVLHFRDQSGAAIVASYRVDGGVWHQAKKVRIKAPLLSHANDGMHVVEVRPVGVGPVTTVRVRIATRPPKVSAAAVSPQLISGKSDMTLSYEAPAQPGVTVHWAVVDSLGHPVGARGAPQPAGGPATVTWKAVTAEGKALPPGTYRLRVSARDAAGNASVAYASFACERAVAAKMYLNLPKAGDLVALTFDGGSGYAWRHIMRALSKLHARGTFFCTGVSVDHYPEVAREAIALGQNIGNHSYDHPDFSTISLRRGASVSSLENAKAWWKACKASPSPFFRPPYGSYNATTLKAAGSDRVPVRRQLGRGHGRLDGRLTGGDRAARRSQAQSRAASSACTRSGTRRRPSRRWSRGCAPKASSPSGWTSCSTPPACSSRERPRAPPRASAWAWRRRRAASPRRRSKARMVGMFITLNCCATAGASSTLSFTNLTVGVVAGHLLEHRADHAARAAPLGPEVHQDLAGLDDLSVEVVLRHCVHVSS